MTEARDKRARALEEWADHVAPGDLKQVDTTSSEAVASLADQSEDVDVAGEGKRDL